MSDERSDDLVTFHNEHFHPDETLAKSIGLVLDEEMDIIIKKIEVFFSSVSQLVIPNLSLYIKFQFL